MVVPDHHVGVLAGLERSHAAVDAEQLRGVDRHERQRLVLAQAAPLHRLGRLGVEPARVLRAVGVDRHGDALARHDGRVVGNRVDDLDLVRPPVGERRAAGAVRGHLPGHLVALEHVLERRDLEAHLVRDAQQHQDLVIPVGVRVHEAPAFEDLDERIELQIAPRRQHVLAVRLPAVVVLPGLLVGPGAREGVANHVLDALARRRVAARARPLARPGPLRVLAERELDARHRAVEDELLGLRLAPAQLDDRVGATDRVRAPVQHVGDRQAAGQVAVDVDVGRIEHIPDAGHRADGRAALVDVVGRDVRVRVDDARRDEQAGGVDHLGVGRDLDVGADGGDLAVAHEHGAVGDGAAGHRQDGGAADGDRGARTLGLAGEAVLADQQNRGDERQGDEPERQMRQGSACHGDVLQKSVARSQGRRPRAGTASRRT